MLLHNFGNTCYINSVLQIFLNNPHFIEYLNTHTFENNKLVASLKNINNTQTLKEFINILKDKIQNKIDINTQNDTSELFIFLLDLIEKEDENCVKMFKGKNKIMYLCKECNNKRFTKEDFIYIPLYITKDTKCLQDCLIKNFQKEIFENIDCECCNKKTTTEKKLKIVEWPSVLLFIIYRYSQVGKVNEEFNYTKNIELSINNTISKYNLAGIINHYGTDINGHYTYIKLDGNIYTEINDQFISNISSYKSSNNYILIYNLKN